MSLRRMSAAGIVATLAWMSFAKVVSVSVCREYTVSALAMFALSHAINARLDVERPEWHPVRAHDRASAHCSDS